MWRLQEMVKNAGNNAQEVVSAENAYQKFLTAMAELTENNVPVAGRVAFVTPTYYSLLKQSGTCLLYTSLSIWIW